MNQIIHIAEKQPAWQTAASVLGVVGALAALAWYGLTSDSDANTYKPLPTAARASQSNPAPTHSLAMAERAPSHAQTGDPGEGEAQRATKPSESGAKQHDAGSNDEFAKRNALVDVRLLTLSRPNAAKTFLTEVLLSPGKQGGFEVAEVLPESRYEKLGLRPGDVIYSLDTPQTAAVDESSMVSLMRQRELTLDVYRNGTIVHLQYDLASNEEDAHADKR